MMKKNVMKTAIVAVCVVAAGMGGFNAHNVIKQSEVDMLLAENVEALSSGDNDNWHSNDRYGEGGVGSGDWCHMAKCYGGAENCTVSYPTGQASCGSNERRDFDKEKDTNDVEAEKKGKDYWNW